MGKHTPGPWMLGNGSRATGFTVKIASDELLVGGYGLKSEANARLIAAAPDLLAALELIERNSTKADWADDIWAALVNAIAKARGDT